jgi:glycosyltransferase involved in cell wall biosynthesis
MIRLGVVNPQSWDFLKDLYPYFSAAFQTSVFQEPPSSTLLPGRVRQLLFRRSLQRFMENNDVVFFEWASDLLAQATHLPKSTTIITRLHRWELYAWADRINWNAVDHIVFVSESKRRAFLRRFPAHPHSTHVIYNGVSLQQFAFHQRPFCGALGTLCHIIPRKRIYDLLLFFSDLRNELPSLTLRVGGNFDPDQTDYQDAIVSLIDKLSLQDAVIFDGYVADPALWYPQIDVFLSHSYSEGLQVAALEAMATGCNVLSHRWEGAEELVPEECLYTTNDDLRGRIRQLCRASESERTQLASRLRSLAVQKFDVGAAASSFTALIQQAADGGRPKTRLS